MPQVVLDNSELGNTALSRFSSVKFRNLALFQLVIMPTWRSSLSQVLKLAKHRRRSNSDVWLTVVVVALLTYHSNKGSLSASSIVCGREFVSFFLVR